MSEANVRILVAIRGMRRMNRAFEGLNDACRLASHRIVTEAGRGWEHPELVLEDDEIEALEARALYRTLADIDDLAIIEGRG